MQSVRKWPLFLTVILALVLMPVHQARAQDDMGDDEGYIPYEPDYPPPSDEAPPPPPPPGPSYEEPPPQGGGTDFIKPTYSTRDEAQQSKVKFHLVKEGEEKKKKRRHKLKSGSTGG